MTCSRTSLHFPQYASTSPPPWERLTIPSEFFVITFDSVSIFERQGFGVPATGKAQAPYSRTTLFHSPRTIRSRISDALFPSLCSFLTRRPSLRQSAQVAPWLVAKQSSKLRCPLLASQLQ